MIQAYARKSILVKHGQQVKSATKIQTRARVWLTRRRRKQKHEHMRIKELTKMDYVRLLDLLDEWSMDSIRTEAIQKYTVKIQAMHRGVMVRRIDRTELRNTGALK